VLWVGGCWACIGLISAGFGYSMPALGNNP
jgi:hypothetical protein